MHSMQRNQRKRMLEKHVYVVGGVDGAIKEALYLSRFAKRYLLFILKTNWGPFRSLPINWLS